MTKTVNSNIAKLLKEKSYEQNIDVGVICRIQNEVNDAYENTRPIKQSDLDNGWSIFNEVYPTIAEAVSWVYKSYHLWVSVYGVSTNKWYYTIRKITPEGYENIVTAPFDPSEAKNSIDEAYEAGLQHAFKLKLK